MILQYSRIVDVNAITSLAGGDRCQTRCEGFCLALLVLPMDMQRVACRVRCALEAAIGRSKRALQRILGAIADDDLAIAGIGSGCGAGIDAAGPANIA